MLDAPNKKKLGHMIEQRACDYLTTKGLSLIARNYYCAYGEIDLIMQETDEIVFIEVRARKSSDYGSALESIDQYKQQKIIKTAIHYLQEQDLIDKVNCRFDVIGFSNNDIDWIKDAFSYE